MGIFIDCGAVGNQLGSKPEIFSRLFGMAAERADLAWDGRQLLVPVTCTAGASAGNGLCGLDGNRYAGDFFSGNLSFS